MPSIVGLTPGQANQTMDGLGMTGARTFTCVGGGGDPTQGIVASQSPGAGALIWNYTGVQAQVNCGAAPPPEDQALD